MQLLAALTEQLKGLWIRWSIAQRVGISAAAAVCVLAIAGTMFWAARSEYVVLDNQMTPKKAFEVTGILDNHQIAYQLNFSGSSISVQRNEVQRARMALKDVLDPTDSPASLSDGGFMDPPSLIEDRRQRQQEQRLARSIMQVRGIRSATVHISKPAPSPFVVEKAPVSASIIVEIAANGQFSPLAAQSIVQMVADAVEGLKPDHVTLMDTSGRQLSSRQGLASSMNEQLEYRQMLESRLARKAEMLLTPVLGYGKAIVQVAADVDFRESTRKEKSYDPDIKVKRSETSEIIQSNSPPKAPIGVVGASANIFPDLPESSGGDFKREMITAEFETGNIEETIRDLPGRIVRLTIAAVVDLPEKSSEASATGTPLPLLADLQKTIERAVGYDAARGDEISVTVAPLATDEVEPTMTPLLFWQQYQPLIQSAVLALSAFLAFFSGLLLLRRMRPVVVPRSDEDTVSVADVRRLQSLSEQARSHPEIVASVLAAWLDESRPADETLPLTGAGGQSGSVSTGIQTVDRSPLRRAA